LTNRLRPGNVAPSGVVEQSAQTEDVMPRATPQEAKRLVKLLERYHRESGRTWNQVSEDVGVSFGTIVKWRRGESRPTGKNYDAILAWAGRVYPAGKKARPEPKKPKAATRDSRLTVDRGTLVNYVVSLAPAEGGSGTVPSPAGLAEALSDAGFHGTVLTLEEFRQCQEGQETSFGALMRRMIRDELDNALSNGVKIRLGD